MKVVDPTIDSGIHDIVAGEENGIVAYYSLNGSHLDGPRSEVCIVRYANGEVRKVIIRWFVQRYSLGKSKDEKNNNAHPWYGK